MKEFSLTDIFQIIKRHFGLVLLVSALSFSFVIVLFLLAQPEYPVSVRIMLEKSQQSALDAPIDLVLGGSNSELSNEIEVFKSRVVLNELITRLNLDYVPERTHNSYLAYLLRRVIWGIDRFGGPVLSELSTSFKTDIEEFEIETTSDTEYLISADKISPTTCLWDHLCILGPYQITFKKAGSISPGARYGYYKESYTNIRESLLNSFYFEALGDRKNANLLEIELTSRDPFVGSIILNELISIVIDKKLEWKRSEAEATRTFVKTVTDKIKTQLNEERNVLATFQAKNKAILPEIQVQGFVTRNEELIKNRQENDIKKKVLEEFLQQISVANNTAISSPVVIANVALEEMISTYNKLLINLKLQEQTLTESHPQIISMRQQMGKTKSDIVAVIKDTIENLSNAQRILDQSLTGIEKNISEMPQNIKNINILYSNIITTERIYIFLTQKLYEAEILSGSTLSGMRLIDDADPWVKKSFPSLSLAILIALFVSFSLGFLTALIKHAMTTTVTTSEEIEAILSGYPVFARIPRLPEKHSEQIAMQWRETFRALYTSIKFSSTGNKKVIGVTSAVPSEGKSIVVSALANICVDFGQKVILIDADMRRPTQHTISNGHKTEGLSGYMVNESLSLEKILVHTKDGYDLLPAGAEPPNPALLLASDRFSALIERLAADYDFVIIDAPPLYAVTDPVYIINSVEVLLFVSRVGTTPQEALKQVDVLFFQKIPPERRNIGIIINGIVSTAGRHVGSYHYGTPMPPKTDVESRRILKFKSFLNSLRRKT